VEFISESRAGWTAVLNFIDLLRGLNGDIEKCEGAREAFRQKWGTEDRFAFRAADATCPAVAYFEKDRWGVLVVHGTDVAAQSPPEAAQYLPPLGTVIGRNQIDIDQPNAAFNEAAGKIVGSAISSFGLGQTIGRLTVIGHSFGHSVSCEAYLNGWIAKNRFPQTQILSVGGNGWANGQKKTLIEKNAEIFRVQNTDDPVTLAPWIFADAAETVLMSSNPVLRRIGNFRHVGRPFNFSPTSDLSHEEFIPLANRIGFVRYASVADWFYSFAGDTVTPHQTSVYKTRIAAYRDTLAENAPRLLPDQTPRLQRPAFFPPPGGEANFFSNTQSQIAGEVRTSPTQSQAIVPPKQGNTEPGQGVRVFTPSNAFVVRSRPGGLHAVTQQGNVVKVFASKRRAKREAKKMNRDRPRAVPE